MNKLIFTIPVLVLAACSGKSDVIKEQSALYQASINQYQGYNCNQITAELKRLSGLIDPQTALLQENAQDKSSQVLDTAVTVFAISRGYGFAQEDRSEEQAVLNRLKSQYNSLDQLFIQKNCVQ